MRPTLFKNARLLDPATRLDAKGAVLVRDGRIVEVGPQVFVDAIQEDVEVVDCAGRCLAPGLVDMRVQTREPGEEHMETLASLQAAAVAGGVTTVATLPNTSPIIDDISILEFVERLAQEVGLVNVHPYAAATKGLKGLEMTEIGLLSASGAVGFTDGVKAIADAQVMRRLLSYATMFGRVVVQHPEEPTLAREGCATEGETATRLGLPGIPACAEVMMVERDLQLVRLTGGRYHAAHVSTAAAIDAIRKAKAEGLAVTCDTAPQYFALNEGAIVDYRTFAHMSPPLRAESDRQAVAEGVADGTVDAIASDHNPEDQDAKRVPFTQSVPGAVGLETLLPVSLGLVHQGTMELLELVDRLTVRPARILGLETGTLAVGSWADLVVFEPDRAVRIDAARFRSKSKNSPFDGKPAQGRVWRTVYRGRTVFDLDAEEPRTRREPTHA